MSLLTRDPMLELHNDVASLLEALPELADVYIVRSRTVTADEVTTINDDIEAALAGIKATASGKSGIALIVMLPEIVFNDDQRATPGPANFDLQIMLRIVENRLINEGANGSRITATALAAALLQIFQLHVFHAGKQLRPARNATEEDTIDGITYLNVRFVECHGLPVESKVLQPTITNSGGSITLACSTSGAAIRYSTDGTMPIGTQGTLYSVPFSTPAAGTRLRVVATKTDHLPSNTVELQL